MNSISDGRVSDLQIKKTDRRIVIASIALGCGSYAFFSCLPEMLGAITESLNLSVADTGLLGSAEMLGMVLGNFAGALGLRRLTYRSVAVLGIMMLMVATLGTFFVTDVNAASALRLLSGLGCGLTIVVSVTILSLTVAPVKNVGLLNAVVTMMGALELAAVPLLVRSAGLVAALAVVGVQVVAAGVLIAWIPAGKRVAAIASGERRTHDRARHLLIIGVVALVATAINQSAPGASWSYGERLAHASGIDAAAMSVLYTLSSLAAAIACLYAWKITARFGLQAPLLAVILVQVLVGITWAFDLHGALGFGMRVVLGGITWALASLLQQTSVATYDLSGTLASAVPFAQGIGQVFGPFGGSLLLSAGLSIPSMLTAFAIPGAISLLLCAWIAFGLNRIDPNFTRSSE